MKNGKMVKSETFAENIANVDDAIMELESNLISKHDDISMINTPKVYVKQQQGFDYVDEGYMRHLLNKYYPIWKWEIIKYEFIGDKAILVHGRLTINDNGVERSFDSVDAHRIASNDKGYVDIGNDLKSANTDCFKVAVNRLCNIADDVYRKRIEDISLSDDQKDEIEAKLEEIKDNEKVVNKIRNGIDEMTINITNFEATIRKIETLI
tara:strand:- start:891 stop:1517 length:627 start_codon:yes stop_codon:yes gene_type:complete